MGFRIATNVQSIAAQRSLGATREGQNRSLEKLSSGERIVRSGDDAAGMAISEKLKAEIRSLRQANRNALDGISLIQTAEGGLNEVGNILIRLRELSIQAASDTIGNTERGFVDKEFKSLIDEVQRISQVTKYNGISLLNGEGDALEIQVGTRNIPEHDRMAFDVSKNNASATKLGIMGLTVESRDDAQQNIDKIDSAIRQVSDNRADFGALQNRLQSTINNLQISDENLSAANSRIRDVDVAHETSELTKRNILAQAGTSMLAQANSNNMLALKLIG
ncbi:MAG: flagellin FliC [Deltaproteobacteria bacterium]|nr:flagellin FliC [Deltaproteobacteria bacterium]